LKATELHHNENLFTTRLFQPGWWVRAFDYASTAGAKDTDVMLQALNTRLCPVLQADELNALAAVLSQFQVQILSSRSDDPLRLTIDTSDFKKQASTRSKSKIFSFTRLLQALPGLRVLVGDEDRFDSYSLFANESWESKAPKAGYQFEVSLEPNGMELVLGYSCSHDELIRRIEGKPSLEKMLGSRTPLSMWRSAWIELHGAEQCLLLRMEKAMQWDCRWLHFEGIFGAPIAELFENIDVTRSFRKSRQLNDLQAAAQIFNRLGKKLCHQGLLKFGVEEKYMALTDGADEGPLLVWQASQQRSFASDNDEYKDMCVRKILAEFSKHRFDKLVSYLSVNVDSSDLRQRVATIWESLQEVDSEDLSYSLESEPTSIPTLGVLLFIEWSIRSEPGHDIPVPEQFLMSPLGVLFGESDEPVEVRYKKFIALFRDHMEFKEALNRIPLSSMSLELASKDKTVVDYLNSFKSGQPASVVVGESKKSFSDNKISKTNATKEIKAPKSTESSTIRKVAAEELANMKRLDVEQYNELKRNYISSLDESRRRLILDVQGRMSQEHFDNHLRHSLIKYMIENPHQWRSVGNKKPLPKGVQKPGSPFLPLLS